MDDERARRRRSADFAARSFLERASTDLLIEIMGYLCATERGRMRRCSRRYTYLVDAVQGIDTDVAIASAKDGSEDSVREAFELAVGRIRVPPTVAFVVTNSFDEDRQRLLNNLAHEFLPPETTLKIVAAADVQGSSRAESSDVSVMLFGWPDATQVTANVQSTSDFESFERKLATIAAVASVRSNAHDAPDSEDEHFWKVIIVTVMPRSANLFQERVIGTLQAKMPKCTIIGGIASAAITRRNEFAAASSANLAEHRERVNAMTVRQLKSFVKRWRGASALRDIVEKSELRALATEIAERRARESRSGSSTSLKEDGISILALGGRVPMRAIVSRGVRSCLSGLVAGGSTEERIRIDQHWTICEGTILRPGTDEYPLVIDPTSANLSSANFDQQYPVYCAIQTVVDNRGRRRLFSDLVVDLIRNAMMRDLEYPRYIGIKRNDAQGFEMSAIVSEHVATPHGVLIPLFNYDASQGPILGAAVDVFNTESKACLVDLDNTLALLKRSLRGERLLGALMFSCNARGPGSRFTGERYADARHFGNVFGPNVPLIGYYAGGEIGPEARVGNYDVFQRGSCALQGFTVVFGVFIVPLPDPARFKSIGDSEETVKAHMKAVLQRKTV